MSASNLAVNEIGIVAHAALIHAGQLLRQWLPDGKQKGSEYWSVNPVRADRTPGSFSINVNTGKWCDLASNDSGGDLVSLRAYLRGCKQNEAAAEIAKNLGMTGLRLLGDYSPIDLEHHRQREDQAAKERAARNAAEQEEEAKRHAEAAAKARLIHIGGSHDLTGHPYFERKGRLNFGGSIRRGRWEQCGWDDALLVPIYGADQKIMSIEAISPAGEKIALKNGAKKGGLYPLASFTKHESGVVIVAEGVATAAACMHATGYPAVAAFCASNLRSAAEVVRKARQDVRIVIAADIGAELDATKAAAAVDGVVAVPAGLTDKGGDFWDVWHQHGAGAVSEAIEAAIRGEPVAPVAATAAVLQEAAPVEFEPVDELQPTKVRNLAPRLVAQQDQVPAAPQQVPAATPKRRTIQYVQGELPAAVDQAEAAIFEQCQDIFQRAGAIVRPVRALVEVAGGDHDEGVRLSLVNKHHLVERLTAAAFWEKFDKRAGDFVPMDCPVAIAETYLARDGSWRLRRLAAIIDAPTLRPDGSILAGEGYDAATGLLVMGDQSRFPAIPAEPSKADAKAALDRLKELIGGFQFVGDADKSVALSAILSACIRRSLPSAPMHCFSAPTAGSGKSTLVDVASIIATGRRAPVMSQGRDEAEQEKRLGAALLAGDAVISIDNATQPIDGDLLCQTMTQPAVRLRVLGGSELRTMPTNAFFCATGNSLLIQGDMTRRALLCSLDPQCERPELRVFTSNPMQLAIEGREQYLCDALTILRAFHVAGRPAPEGGSLLGSFEAWSGWVRNALVWLEEADPVTTMEAARKGDPKLEAITALMAQWDAVIGARDVTVREVISIATEQGDAYSQSRAAFLNEDFREALLTVAGQGGVINSRSLGKWLAAHKGRIVSLPEAGTGTRRFSQGPLKHKVATWNLENPQKK